MPRLAPYAIILVLLVALSGMTHLYLGKRDELADWKATVATLGRVAETTKVKVEKEGADNLKKVKADYEATIPQVRSAAVANYRARHAGDSNAGVYVSPGSGAVPGNGPGLQVDDAASKERISVEPGFIEDSAEDAGKVEAWRAWCTLNHCPIKD